MWSSCDTQLVEVQDFRALNAFSIRAGLIEPCQADIVINGVPLNVSWWANSSDTDWCTVYNKSSWVLFINSTIEALQLTEIILIIVNLSNTALLILYRHDKIDPIPTRNDYHYFKDNKVYSFRNIERIEYQIDHHKIHFTDSAIPVSGTVMMPYRNRWMIEVWIYRRWIRSRLRPFKKHEVSKWLLHKIKFRGGAILIIINCKCNVSIGLRPRYYHIPADGRL